MGRGDECRPFNSTQVFPDAVVMSLGVDAKLTKALNRERSTDGKGREFSHGFEIPEEIKTYESKLSNCSKMYFLASCASSGCMKLGGFSLR